MFVLWILLGLVIGFVCAAPLARGMLRRGLASSPDMLAPAMIPVAAGKNTANTAQKSTP